jgi:hypothetical protein
VTEAGTLLSTSAGVALIGLVGRDAFDALFHAEGSGTFSRQLTRAVWWVFRRAGTRHGLFSIAGPVALVTVIATWAGLLVLGWALVFWPHMPGGFRFDAGVEAAGPDFVDALNVSLVTLTTINVLLLDEPDAHLHSSLQEQLLGSLRTIAASTDKQVLVATHSAEILRSAEPTDILHVRAGGKGGRYLFEERQKVGLLAGMGSDYAPRVDRAKRTKRILFVEGRSDVPILKILADKLGMAWPTEWTEWTTAYSQKERKQLYLALKEEVPDLLVLSLRDRDDEPAETVKPTSSIRAPAATPTTSRAGGAGATSRAI